MNNQGPSNLTDRYQILGVSFNASEDELRRAYRRMAMQWHPDRNKSPDALPMMQKINQAWEILGNPESKAEYDRDYFLLRSILAEARRREVEEERLERERREEERRRREAQQREAERLERERRAAQPMSFQAKQGIYAVGHDHLRHSGLDPESTGWKLRGFAETLRLWCG